MTEIVFTIVRYGVAVAVGIVIGVIFSSGKVKVKGKPVTIPYIERTGRNFTLVVVLLLTFSFISVANTAIAANRQEQCNAAFRSIIASNSQGTAEAAETQDNLWRELSGFLTTPPVVPEGQTPSAADQAMAVSPADIATSIDRYLAKREEVKANRADNPYPVNCGK